MGILKVKKIFKHNFSCVELFMFASIDYLLTLIGVRLGFLREVNIIVNMYIESIIARILLQSLIVAFLATALRNKWITNTTINIISWAEIAAITFLISMYMYIGVIYLIIYF